MKKGLIVFLVFAVVLVIGLMITGVFGKAEANTATLKVNATNTTIVVRDDQDQVISNDNGVLIIGDTYTVTVTPYDDCILQYFTINDINYFKKLENNQCSFVCNGNVSIKTISVVDPTLEEPPVAGVTTVYSATFSSCQVAGPSIGSVKNVDTITLILYDSTNSVVARLGVGETFDLLIEKETYRVEYSSSVVYKNVKITNTSIDLKYHNLPYTFTAKSDANLKITSFNTAAMAVIPGWVFLVGEQEKDTEFVAGETYTLSDNAPEGLKTNLYVNNQLVQLPYTFTYSEDMTFDFELVEAPVVETATISVTSNVEGYAIHYAFVDNLYERTLVDETTELIVGGDYVFYVTPPSGYYLTVWGGTFGLTSEDYIPSTSGRGGVIEEPGAIEFDLTFKPAVTPTINGENFTTTFTNAYGEETNILVLGQRYTATFTPNEGYQMYRITNENGSSIDFSQPYTFTAAEGMLFDVNCFEICEPTIDFDIPNASYVVRDAATHVAVSSPYVVGAEYEIYIFSNEGYVLGDIAFAGWQESTGVFSGSYTAVSSSQYLYLTAIQTKLVISGTTLALITPTIVVYGPDDGVNFDELVTASYYYPSTSNSYYNAARLISTQDYVFRLSLSGEYEFSEIRVDGVVSNIEFSLVGNYYKSSGYIPFVAHEGILIEVYVVSLPLYATPELTVLVGGLYGDPYEGNFYDIGQILYYEPGTETYTTNPLIEHTYDIVIKINDDVLHSLFSGVTRFNNSLGSVAETYYSPNRYVIGEKYSNVYVTRFLNIKFVIGNRPAITYTTPTFVGENFTAVITDTNGVEQTNLVVNGIYTIVFTANPGYKIEKVTYNNSTVDITQPFEFRPKESTIFTVRTVQVNAGITPTITLSGYTGELSDVGSIKFRADTTSSNYITENLVVDTTYEATISTFSSSYYYISAVYVNGELVATNADSSTAMFTCQITATEDMEITLECTRK